MNPNSISGCIVLIVPIAALFPLILQTLALRSASWNYLGPPGVRHFIAILFILWIAVSATVYAALALADNWTHSAHMRSTIRLTSEIFESCLRLGGALFSNELLLVL